MTNITDSITILSDISLDAHCINVIVVSRVTVVLEVLFLSAQSMVLCLMHMTWGHDSPASDSVPPVVWIGLWVIKLKNVRDWICDCRPLHGFTYWEKMGQPLPAFGDSAWGCKAKDAAAFSKKGLAKIIMIMIQYRYFLGIPKERARLKGF